MIEIYLFINPVGPICYHSETALLEILETLGEKVQLQILPLVNLKTVGIAMDDVSLDKKDILLRNEQAKNIYSAALDYKAAQLQGKKIARELLLKMQKCVGCDKESYSPELVEQLFLETSGNLEMFKEDRQSELVRKNFLADQEVARDMGITTPPSAVVYNFSCDRDYGVLLEGPEAFKNIPRLCKTDYDNYQIFHVKEKSNARKHRLTNNERHLILL